MTYWRLFYHVVWGTRDRLPTIDDRREPILRRLLTGAAREEDSLIHAIGIMPDHVHVVLSIPPKAPVSRVVAKLKGSSSHYLAKHKLAAPHAGWTGWQSEYGILSFAERDLDSVVRYVTHQRERHANNQINQALEQMIARYE